MTALSSQPEEFCIGWLTLATYHSGAANITPHTRSFQKSVQSDQLRGLLAVKILRLQPTDKNVDRPAYAQPTG